LFTAHEGFDHQDTYRRGGNVNIDGRHDFASIRALAQVSRFYWATFGWARCQQCTDLKTLRNYNFQARRIFGTGRFNACGFCNFDLRRRQWLLRKGKQSGECEGHLVCGSCVLVLQNFPGQCNGGDQRIGV
jgi:hypothetical protein